MRKKWFVVFLLLALFGSIYWLSSRPGHFPEHCPFCDPKVLARQTFYEDALVLALYTHKPVLEGHCLIIPKRHVERFEELTDEEITHVGQMIRRVDQAVMKVFGTSSYLLLQKNGLEVGQSVQHVHVHYMPRKAGDYSSLGFLAKMYMANMKGPISAAEMQEITEKLRKSL